MRGAAPPRARAVPETLYALVDSHADLRTAQADGRSVLFTDHHRWSTPPPRGRRVQYLLGSREASRARARASTARLLSLSDQDLRADRGPHLLTVRISRSLAVDLHGGPALVAAGLPPEYPDPVHCDVEALRPVCREAGDRALDLRGGAGNEPAAVVVRPVEHPVCMHDEVLVDVDGPALLSVRGRQRWRDWN